MKTRTPLDVEAIFRDAGALREGHFVLASGRHSARYLEKFHVLQYPRETERLAAAIADWARTLGVATVAGPTTGGIILAFETGRQLGVRAIFAEEVRDSDGSTRREFRRGFRIAPGERVLLVDDILTTGGSLLAMLPAVEAMGGDIIECVVLVDRSGGGTNMLTITSQTASRSRVRRTRFQRCQTVASRRARKSV